VQHWRVTRDAALVESMVGPIAKGVHWIDRKRHARKAKRNDPALRGLFPAGVSAEHLGPFDYFYWDDFWGVAGLRAGAELLRAVDQQDAAAEAERFAASMWDDVERSLVLTAKRLGTVAIPAGPRRRMDAGAIGSLVACTPLDLLPPHDPRIAATADVIRKRFTLEGVPPAGVVASDGGGRAFFQGISHTGLGTYLTLQLAAVELRNGDRRSLDRLAWMLDVATPTWTWPEAIHPRLDGGCMGDGHHGWAAAEFLALVRDLLVCDIAGGVALASLVPDGWYGRGWEVHDAPTAVGRVSYAVRWHGDRAALLWEVTPHPGVADVRLTAPGLDASWSTSARHGEALLGPVVAPPGPSAAAGATVGP
jgi:hypothetical protein